MVLQSARAKPSAKLMITGHDWLVSASSAQKSYLGFGKEEVLLDGPRV